MLLASRRRRRRARRGRATSAPRRPRSSRRASTTSKRARELYATVLAEDPGHAKACDGDGADRRADGGLRDARAASSSGASSRAEGRRTPTRSLKIAEVYEDQLEDLAEATRRFEAVLASTRTNLEALKGLDRIYNRTGKYRELLANLEQPGRGRRDAAAEDQPLRAHRRRSTTRSSSTTSAPPRRSRASSRSIPTNDAALTALARHYRVLEQLGDAEQLYEQARRTSPATRRGGSSSCCIARACSRRRWARRTARRRRTSRCSRCSPTHAGALEALAQAARASGDAHAALTAIEALAAKAATPEAKAEQWMRAARLLEGSGDKDGAIERYKLALDANPPRSGRDARRSATRTPSAATASVVGLIETRARTRRRANLARARLWAELAKVHHSQLVDPQKAETAARKAVDLDPSNADGLMVLGDLAFEAGRMLEASKHFESLVEPYRRPRGRRTRSACSFASWRRSARRSRGRRSRPPAPLGRSLEQDLSGPLSSAAWVGGGPASQGRISVVPSSPGTIPPPPVTNPRMMAAVEALKQLAPQDVDALARAANALFEFGDPNSAYSMHEELFKKYGDVLAGSDRAEALYHLGESARRSGNLDAAVEPLREAADLDPSNPRPYQRAREGVREKGEWKSAIGVRKSRLEVATGNERFELLLEIGDVEFTKLERPDRRAEDVLAGPRGAPRRPQAPHEADAALLGGEGLGEARRGRAPPGRLRRGSEAARQVHAHRRDRHRAAARRDRQGARLLRARPRVRPHADARRSTRPSSSIGRRARTTGSSGSSRRSSSRPRHAQDRAQDRQGPRQARRALPEAPERAGARRSTPTRPRRRSTPTTRSAPRSLAELYASDPGPVPRQGGRGAGGDPPQEPVPRRELQAAAAALHGVARAGPRVVPLPGAGVLSLAEPDEERFYRRHRAENAAPAQAALDDDDWAKRSMHVDADPILTRIFAIDPADDHPHAHAAARGARVTTRASRSTRRAQPYPVSQTLYYVAGRPRLRAAARVPEPERPGGARLRPRAHPGIVLGRAAFEPTCPNQSLAFVAGRHLT